jgi:RimJ/RimL family protein N-acetyltransferase
MLALRNNPVVNRFMLRTRVEPETYRQEWLTIPTSDTDFSCVAQFDDEIVGLGFLDLVDGMGQPGMPQRTQGVMGYMLEPGFAGRGFGTDLARGLLSAAFDKTGINTRS